MLAERQTYNDSVWVKMLNRDKAGYSLTGPKSREDLVKKRFDKSTGKVTGKLPMPMPDNKVKPNWEGKTKGQLPEEPDFLPAFVRQLPRAYVVPPPAHDDRKRKKETAVAEVAGPALRPQLPPPSSLSELGKVAKASHDYQTGVTTYEYTAGFILTRLAPSLQTSRAKKARMDTSST